MIIENSHYLVEFANGKIIGFYDLETNRNLAARNGICGTACFTLKSDDIRTLPHEPFESYADRTGKYDSVEFLGENAVVCKDTENKIITNCRMDETGLVLTSETDNPEISEFGLNLDLNFMGKKGTDYHSQLLPTSPYTSADGSHMYCLMTCPNGRFLIAAAQTFCDGWRIKYSPYSAGHYIQNFQILASFDQVYGGSGRKKLQIRLQCADSLESAFRQIQHIYQVPLCRNLLSGGFDGYAFVKAYGKADAFQVSAPDGHIYQMKPGEKITLTEFGLHTVTPICQGVPGLNTTVWNGGDMISLFDKSCDAIQKPYHTDDNLCEGGCFLWAMLVNMRLHNSRKYDAVVREELDIIMGKRKPVPRRTILPYPADGYPAWHIFQSNRVQEQFFGVSILLEAYKLYQRPELLEYATAALQELVADHMKDGMVYNGEDYTTVCCPMIPLVDMANYLKAAGDDRQNSLRRQRGKWPRFFIKEASIFRRKARYLNGMNLRWRMVPFPAQRWLCCISAPDSEKMRHMRNLPVRYWSCIARGRFIHLMQECRIPVSVGGKPSGKVMGKDRQYAPDMHGRYGRLRHCFTMGFCFGRIRLCSIPGMGSSRTFLKRRLTEQCIAAMRQTISAAVEIGESKPL